MPIYRKRGLAWRLVGVHGGNNMEEKLKKFLISSIMVCLLILQPLNVNMVKGETIYVDRKADVVFTIDATGSMQPYITSVKKNLESFISQINGEKIDVRVKFIVYRDITYGEQTVVSDWYNSADTAIEYLESISADGGGDGPETMLDGMGKMFSSGFGMRSDAFRFCITLTDAPTKINNNYGYTCEEEVIQKLKDNAVNSSVITSTDCFDDYENFVSEDGGILADIAGDYSVMLKELSDSVINGVEHMVIHEIYPKEGLVNFANVVSVRATGINFDEEFYVKLGDKDVSDVVQTSNGFKFTTPTDLGIGSYDIVVKNGKDAEEKVIGQYTYVEKEEDIGYKIKKINPSTSEEGVKTLVTVTVDKITYSDEFSVSVGSINAEVKSKNKTSFSFYVPTTLVAGTYDIRVGNGKEKKIGKYIITAAPKITQLDKNETEEGTAVTVKAIATGKITYGSDFKVLLGTTEVGVSYRGSSFFKFTVPKTMSAGEYEVKVVNNGQTKTVGTFTVKAKAAEELPDITGLDQNETEEGTAVTVKATATGKITYGSDFKVLVGSVEVSVGYRGSTFFKFTVPRSLKAGKYDVTLINNGQNKTIGTFTVKSK